MMGVTYEEMLRQLQDIFPNKTLTTIQSILDIVNTENPEDSHEYRFESAINLLSETGNGEIQLYDEAVGGTLPNENVCLENLFQIFPDCQVDYLKAILKKHGPLFNFDDVVDELSLSK